MKHTLFGFIAVALAVVAAFFSPMVALVLAVAAVAAFTLPSLSTRLRTGAVALVSLLFLPFVAVAQTTGAVPEPSGWLAIFEALPGWLVAITSVVTAATAITALTPTKTDDRIISAILRVLNILAGNFGKNTNADDK